jgi:hypothetical protein
VKNTHTIRRRHSLILQGIATLTTLVALSGCGGGGSASSNSKGRAATLELRFRWPAATGKAVSRLIPEATESVVVSVQDAQGFRDSRTLNRPASGDTVSAFFFALSEGDATVSATAFDDPNGQGRSLAQAQATASLGAGQTDNVELTFVAPFGRVEITPAGGTLLQGQTLTLSARGLSDAGDLLQSNPPGQWVSSAPGVATVNAQTGQVTGLQPGSTTITFTDSQFNRSASVTVTVRGGASEVIIQ